MSWELVKVIVGYGIALYVCLDRIERMLRELTKKDGDKDADKDEPEK